MSDPEFDYGPDGPKRSVTCHTEDCGNAGAPIIVPDDGSPVFCGPCGHPITTEGD